MANDASLGAFAQRHAWVGQFRTLRGQHRGKAWVALMVGDFATLTEAEAALNALPQDLRRLKPLVRPLPGGTRLLSVPTATKP